MYASSGIRTHDPSVQEGEDGSRLRTRGHSDRRTNFPSDKYLQRYVLDAVLWLPSSG
jgi:hypothetical protein